jgi:fructose-1,6-bisphosphatase I
MQSSTIPTFPTSPFPPKTLLFSSKTQSFPSKSSLLAQSCHLFRPKMASLSGFIVRSQTGTSSSGEKGFSTLNEYMGKGGIDVGDELVVLYDHIQYASKRIAALVASPLNSSLSKQSNFAGGDSGSGRDAPKPLDIVSVCLPLTAPSVFGL